ncbi:lactonase family protein [Alicyclobacillus kakegawensis]|uniref:lactonase family protein n=1 Tax=Alicyclobacillus kakegawensis TaxID=392012 RepID=UPI00082C5DE9|nr:lactonase family protein [Alicyclobacillus kakegawensis]
MSPMPGQPARTWFDIFIGSYSAANEAGIHWLQMNPCTGQFAHVDSISGIENPSFLAVHPSGAWLYSVSETDEGQVVSLLVDRASRKLRTHNRAATDGAAPCHIQFAGQDKFLVVTNYGSGSVCTLPLGPDGRIGEVAMRVVHHGRGLRPDRQEGPHPHSAMPVLQSPWILVPDLGLDQAIVYRLDETTGALQPHGSIRTRAGAGPRHAAFHPRSSCVYVCCELDSTIVCYAFDRAQGRMVERGHVSLLPPGCSAAANTAADIHVSPSGRFLYASNRGHDSIACFLIGENGELTSLGHVHAGGRTPRNFELTPDGWYMIVASQDDDRLHVFSPNDRGQLRPTGYTYPIHRPVCVQVYAPGE